MTDKKNHIEKRITLNSIEKKEVFKVSEGYFDDLPTRIQNRAIAMEHKSSPGYLISRSLKYALPVIAIIIMSIYFGNRFNENNLDVQALLDEVPTSELIAYLSDSDLSTDEILTMIDIDELDIDGMMDEDIGLLNDVDLDEVLDEYPDYETDL
jgi:hypothetical protein